MSDEIPNIHMLISPKDDQGKMVDECIGRNVSARGSGC